MSNIGKIAAALALIAVVFQLQRFITTSDLCNLGPSASLHFFPVGHTSIQYDQLGFPTYLVADKHGNVYISDTNVHVIRKLSGDEIVTIAGTFSSAGFSASQMSHPRGLALDHSQRFLYFADSGNHCIRKIDLQNNNSIHDVAGWCTRQGNSLGPAHQAQFRNPVGVAVNSRDEVFVGDSGNHQMKMVMWESETNQLIVELMAGSGMNGDKDGEPMEAQFAVTDIALVEDETALLVADTENSKIKKLSIAMNRITTLASEVGSIGAMAVAGEFIFFTDTAAGVIKRISMSGEKNYNSIVASGLNNPFGIAVSSCKIMYVSDQSSIQKLEA